MKNICHKKNNYDELVDKLKEKELLIEDFFEADDAVYGYSYYKCKNYKCKNCNNRFISYELLSKHFYNCFFIKYDNNWEKIIEETHYKRAINLYHYIILLLNKEPKGVKDRVISSLKVSI